MTEFDRLVLAWGEAAAELASAKDRELKLRNAIVAAGFPSGIAEGVNNRELGQGYVLKATGKFNYSLDNKNNGAAVVAVANALPAHVAQALFSWGADLKVAAYRSLDPTHKRLVDNVLTIKPGQSQLELVEPPSAKAPVVIPTMPAAPLTGWRQ